MSLLEVLAAHKNNSHEYAKNEILGDGFLLQSNSVYLSLRKKTIEVGSQLVEADTGYLLMPFHQLKKIESTKKIPFIPSGRLLEEIESQWPEVFSSDDISLPESYHLHESAHVVAHECFRSFQAHSPAEKVLKFLICESIANTVDALAWVDATSEEHRFFLDHNCYMKFSAKNQKLLTELVKEMGFSATALLVLFAYLHANFLSDGFNKSALQKIHNSFSLDLEMSPRLIKNILSLQKMAEKLDPLFRVRTTENFLKMEFTNANVDELLDFDFLEMALDGPLFRNSIQEMLKVFEI